MTSTIVPQEPTTSNGYNLDAAIADALAAHDAQQARLRQAQEDKERSEREAVIALFMREADKVLPAAFLDAISLTNISPSSAEFVRNGHRYEIRKLQVGWAVAQIVSDGRHLNEAFTSDGLYRGLLTYIGKTERLKTRVHDFANSAVAPGGGK